MLIITDCSLQPGFERMQRVTSDELKPLLSAEQIATRVAEIGRAIEADCPAGTGLPPLRLIGVLKGAAVFLTDLARRIRRTLSVDFIGVASYGQATETLGQVRLTKDLDHDIAGLDVILVEDIVDTGLTLRYLLGLLERRQPRSLRVATLLDKPSQRVEPVELDYVGFEIPDEFVVGYGLDFDQQYRNLPDIRVLTGGTGA